MTSYDENLLASAPKATKAQLQSGYNPDLLVEKTSPSTPPTPAVDLEAANRVTTPVQRQESPASLTKKTRPFYANKKWIIIFVVALVAIIIAAVVGGVVGSRKSNKSQNTSTSGSQANGSATATSKPSAGTQGNGPTSSSSSIAQGVGSGPSPTPSSQSNGVGGSNNT